MERGIEQDLKNLEKDFFLLKQYRVSDGSSKLFRGRGQGVASQTNCATFLIIGQNFFFQLRIIFSLSTSTVCFCV